MVNPVQRTARVVLEGESESKFASVQEARRLLHEGPGALAALARDLADGMEGGANDVKVERYVRLLYATDASIYEMEPVAVVFPRGAADVQHVMQVASEYGVPVLPRGGGTGLSGQTVNHAIVLDFTTHMDRVLSIDAEARTARVQPGVVLSELSKAVREFGLQYPIDPSTANRATIGGGIGNNSCGAHSAIYGKTVDNVVSLEVVLADGTLTQFGATRGAELAQRFSEEGTVGAVYRGVRELTAKYAAEVAERFPTILRRVSGYNLDAFDDSESMNLAEVIVGSEGTLATVTEATVRLVPIPTMKGLAAVHFASVVEAARATVVANQLAPSAVELVDATIIERCRASSGYRDLVEFVQGKPAALLLVEFYSESEDELKSKLAALWKALQVEGLGFACVTSTNAAEQLQRWRMREAGLGLLMSVRGDAKPVAFVEDTAVPPERLAEYVERFDAAVRARGLKAGYYGHASVGCLHIRPIVNLKEVDGLVQTEELAGEIADLVLEFGGSLSGEHGDGIVRGAFTERMFGERLTHAFRELKQLFDPEGLLNPGKITDTPPFTDNLRLSPKTVNAKPSTLLDFSVDGGLAGAAEQCNGQGACRKHDGGMCPSFFVTGDEEHSTRGRANLLREALNGGLAESELVSDRMMQALDLCVECKACKSECPSGVDLAKLKYEVLTKHHQAHGTPMRRRAFARINLLSRLAGPVAPLINRINQWGPFRTLLERYGRVDRRRPLPRLASTSFPRWWSKRKLLQTNAPRGEAVYFDDTFTDYYQPEVGRAAVQVLEALGYRVRVVSQLACCGRPAISQGQLGLAKHWATQNVKALLPFAEQGIPIVGTEPSCLLALRDEYPELVQSQAARVVARQTILLEELLIRLSAEEGKKGVREIFRDERSAGQNVLLHGHCHQKAITGAELSVQALELAGYAASLIDSGCCGMAGSFGFEAEHYEISRAMGAYRLFPALDAAAAKTSIAITGVSCRQQIGHFTDHEPRHVVEYLADVLKSND